VNLAGTERSLPAPVWSQAAAEHRSDAARGTGSQRRAAEVLEPDTTHAPLYDELSGLYRVLYPATQPMQHALARLQFAGSGLS
jgi:hypothetical protein